MTWWRRFVCFWIEHDLVSCDLRTRLRCRRCGKVFRTA